MILHFPLFASHLKQSNFSDNPAKSKLLLNSLTNLAKILLNLANSPPSLNYPSAVFKLIKAKSFF